MKECDTKIAIHKKQIGSIEQELEEKTKEIADLMENSPKDQEAKMHKGLTQKNGSKDAGSSQNGQVSSTLEDDDDELDDVELNEADWEGEGPETIARLKEGAALLKTNQEERKKQKAIREQALSQAAADHAEAQAALIAKEEERKKIKSENGVALKTIGAEVKRNKAALKGMMSNLKSKTVGSGASAAKK